VFGAATRALGQLVSIGGKHYTVVGVLEREEFYFAAWEDNALEYRNERAYIPISTAIAQHSAIDHLDFLTLKARPGVGAGVAQAQVRSLLYARHGVEDFDIRGSGRRGWGGRPVPAALQLHLPCRGVVSLITGGIVIANILLASVVERVREFGTRMALGATGGAIFAHVLAEVLVVTVMGGLLGLGLGTALTGVVAHFMQMPAVVSPFIAAFRA